MRGALRQAEVDAVDDVEEFEDELVLEGAPEEPDEPEEPELLDELDGPELLDEEPPRLSVL